MTTPNQLNLSKKGKKLQAQGSERETMEKELICKVPALGPWHPARGQEKQRAEETNASRKIQLHVQRNKIIPTRTGKILVKSLPIRSPKPFLSKENLQRMSPGKSASKEVLTKKKKKKTKTPKWQSRWLAKYTIINQYDGLLHSYQK